MQRLRLLDMADHGLDFLLNLGHAALLFLFQLLAVGQQGFEPE